MNYAEEQMNQQYRERYGLDRAATAAEQLATVRVLVLADGALGLEVVRQLAALPLGMLVAQPIDSASSQLRALQDTAAVRVQARPWSAHNAALQLRSIDLLVVGLERPAPLLLASINQLAQRLNLRWLPVVQWGVETRIGPTIVPGLTACHECFRRRWRASASRVDVSDALDAYFTRDSDARLRGQLAPLLRAAAVRTRLEVRRLLTAEAPAASLNAALVTNAIHGTAGRHWVVAVEHCPDCTVGHRRATDDLGRVARQAAQKEDRNGICIGA